MRLALRERLSPVLAVAILAAVAPGIFEWTFGHHHVHLTGTVHFYAVGLTALAAAAAAIALTVIGARFGDLRTVLIGNAFGVMAALLALHGLSTPGVLMGNNGVVMFTGGATLPAGALLLALSVVPLPRFLRSVRSLLALEGLLLAIVIGLGVSGIVFPSWLPAVPTPNSPAALATLAAGLALFALLTWRAFRTYLLTRRISDLVVTVGIVWLATALVAALTLMYVDLGWWFGHMLELDGILLVGIPVAVDLARTTQSRPLSGDLHAVDLVTSQEAFLGAHVRALALCLATRDEYTDQHVRRVALLAVQVGEDLGLSTGRLRALAIGGLVHDIGKLSVPDSVLKKPGPLDDEEYDLIKRHPLLGVKLLDELGGFPSSVLRLVQDHHERLDGNGYPHGLSAESLQLDTRILTVCDVYDALISARVYREAWSHDDAIALLRRDAGTAFDDRVVGALVRVLEHEAEAAPEQQQHELAVAVAPA